MNIKATWVYDPIIASTALSFCKEALPDSVLAQWHDDDTCPHELFYELADAVPDTFESRAFHVHVALQMMDTRLQDAELDFVIDIPMGKNAYVHDLFALRQAEPTTGSESPQLLAWDALEHAWETFD